jgi:acetyl esterase
MKFFWGAYGGPTPWTDPLFCPHITSVRGLPSTILAVAGFDVLADEGRRFARRLISSNVRLTHLPYPSLPPAFADHVDRVDAARHAIDQVLAELRTLLTDRTA